MQQDKVYVVTKMVNGFDVKLRMHCATMGAVARSIVKDMDGERPSGKADHDSEVKRIVAEAAASGYVRGHGAHSYVIEAFNLIR